MSWQRLSPNLKGAIWVTIGTLAFALTDAVVKILGATIHPIEMGLFRYAVGLVVLAPLFLRLGWKGLKTHRPGLHAFRVVIASIGQIGAFYAVVHLLLADATAIMFSRPLFVCVLAVMMLGEHVGRRRWVATAIGFAGVLVMLRPGASALEPAAIVAVVNSFLFALGLIIVRRLASTEPPLRILFYYHVGALILFIGPTAAVWTTPTAEEWAMLIVIGLLTTAAVTCFVRGFSIGESSVVGPMEYTRLVYAAAIGYILFAEEPDIYTAIGAAIIVGSAIFIARSEARGRGAPRPQGAVAAG